MRIKYITWVNLWKSKRTWVPLFHAHCSMFMAMNYVSACEGMLKDDWAIQKPLRRACQPWGQTSSKDSVFYHDHLSWIHIVYRKRIATLTPLMYWPSMLMSWSVPCFTIPFSGEEHGLPLYQGHCGCPQFFYKMNASSVLFALVLSACILNLFWILGIIHRDLSRFISLLGYQLYDMIWYDLIWYDIIWYDIIS